MKLARKPLLAPLTAVALALALLHPAADARSLKRPDSIAPSPVTKPAAKPATSSETVAFAPGVPLQKHVLANGLTVLLLPLPFSPVTTYHTWVDAGSRDEKPGITGIAHLFEHMMFRPVQPGAKSYFEMASALGMQYNASTRFNATDYYATFKPELLSQVAALESNRFKHMRATDELLKVEREAVRSEYSTKFDANPVIDLWFHVYAYAFPGHPYGWHIIGQREDLDRITAADCNRFFAANYAPNNAMIAIAGPIEPVSTLALIKQHYSDWKPATTPKPRWSNEPARGTAPVLKPAKLPAPTKYMLIGYRLPERTQPDRLAQDLAHYMLFNEKTSLVGKRLIDELHLASESDAFNTFYDIGLSKLMVVPNPGVSHARVLSEVQAAIDGFAKLPDVDFQAHRQAYATYLREGQLKTHAVTNSLGLAWAYDGNYKNAFQDPGNVLKIPRAEIARILKSTYAATNRVTAVTP